MRAVGVDIVTIGQYLRPTARHRKVDRYVHPDEFASYREYGEGLGLRHVESGPLVRSSYHAKEAAKIGGCEEVDGGWLPSYASLRNACRR